MTTTDGTIALSFAGLNAAESELGGNLAALRARLDQLATELAPLVHSWSGDAQAAYLVQKQQWEQAADDLALMLQTIVTGLGSTSAEFTDTQRRIVAAFS